MKYKILNITLGVISICLSVYIIVNVSSAIFSQPLNIIFYDGWSYLTLKQGLFPFSFHNEHNIFLANVAASVGPIFGKVFGSYNIIFAQILRFTCLIVFLYTIYRLIKGYKEFKNTIGFLCISLSSLMGSIFIFNPFSYRSLGWGFMLHWYIPLTILFLNGLIIYTTSFRYKFYISYLLCLVAFFSGGHWIICFASVFLSFYTFDSFTFKSIAKNLRTSMICLLPIILINTMNEAGSSGLMQKLFSLKFMFILQTIRYSYLDASPSLIIMPIIMLILYYKILSVNSFSFPEKGLSYSLYLCFSGFLFAFTVSLARGNSVDADYTSGSYPTFVGLVWLGICTFYSLVILSVKNLIGKYLYLLILPSIYLGSPALNAQSNFNNKINTLKTERKWHVISYFCRRIGFIYQNHGYKVIYKESCGNTYVNEKRPYELWSSNIKIKKYNFDINPVKSKANLINDQYKFCTKGNQSTFQPKFIEYFTIRNCMEGMNESEAVNGKITATETSNTNIIIDFISYE